MNPRITSILKFIGAWFCIIVAVVILIIERQAMGALGIVGWAALSIAFSQAPNAW